MRTNIDIDDDLMAQALRAGPFKTKKEAVEAGLRLVARQAAYREILKWEGKLKWEGDESVDWTQPPASGPADTAPAPGAGHASPGGARYAASAPLKATVAAEPSPERRRARR